MPLLLAAAAIALWREHGAREVASAALMDRDRARASRDFWLGILRADGRTSTLRRRLGETTVKELLDFSTPKIAQRYAGDPQTELELLGDAARIYFELGDREAFQVLHEQQYELERRVHDEPRQQSVLHRGAMVRKPNSHDW